MLSVMERAGQSLCLLGAIATVVMGLWIAPISQAQETPPPPAPPAETAPPANSSSSSNAGNTEQIRAEIQQIRQELLQLLTRLAALEAQVNGGSPAPPAGTAPGNSAATTPTTSPAQSEGQPAPPPGTNLFGNPVTDANPPDPNSQTLSLGTQTISLPGDVLFDFNKDNLRSEATDLLKQVAGLLKAMPSGQIQVAGHTDNIGSDQYNLDLSLRRADAVEKYLKEVLPNNGGKFRWTSIGYGATSPIADNSTDEGRQRNRRVDLIVTP